MCSYIDSNKHYRLRTPNVDEQGPYEGLSGLLIKHVYKNDDNVDQSASLFLS